MTLALLNLIQIRDISVAIFTIEICSFDLLVRSSDEKPTCARLDMNLGAWIDRQMRANAILIAYFNSHNQQLELSITNSKK